MGVSCGNPTAFASLKVGETVVDLGSGGGLDVFLAVRRVGPTGRVIGIDMTPEMIELARPECHESEGTRRQSPHQRGVPPGHDRPHAIARELGGLRDLQLRAQPSPRTSPRLSGRSPASPKPGGRLAASDIALLQPLPDEVAGDIFAYVGCTSQDTILVPEYRRTLLDCGFSHVDVVPTATDLGAYAKIENQVSCCSPAGSPGSGCCEPVSWRPRPNCCHGWPTCWSGTT